MVKQVCLLLLVMGAVCLGDAAPTTQPDGPRRPAALPTPDELAARARKLAGESAEPVPNHVNAAPAAKSTPRIAFFDLTTPLVEKPAEFSLFGDASAQTFRSLIERVNQARDDKQIHGVLITLGESVLNMSQALELRDSLLDLRKGNKRSFIYADSYDTSSYLAASGATDICLLGGGDIMIPGVGFQTMFAKGVLDKIGVEADYVQIGKYKGADEEYTRSSPSPELTGELNKLVESMYGELIDTISFSRKLPPETVKTLVDQSIIPAAQAKEQGLVDHLLDVDGLRDLMNGELGDKVDLVHDYGEVAKEQLDISNPLALFSMLARHETVSTRPAVALVYAEGVIVDGGGGTSLLEQSQTIGSEDIRQAMRLAERDDHVKAIVVRIDSPGGSALASEAMWQAVRRAAEKKPVIISVGTMAASGGYYLASSGQYIFADPTAIVGSIGVVGGKFVIKDALDKIGLTIGNFNRGANSGLFDMTTPWTDQQRAMVTHWMEDTYKQFTERVMTTRKGKIADISEVAQGRIFMARQAKDLGMVDAIGGEEAAIAYAASQGRLSPGEYDVRVLPPSKTLADYLASSGFGTGQMPFTPKMELTADSVLRLMPASTRRLLLEQMQMYQLFQSQPVQLISPCLVTVK